TEEQKTRLAALSRVMADRRNNNPAEEAVAGILRPEQLQRLRGLRYQQLENARNIAGAAVLYRYRPFVEGLALSEEQRQRLQQLVNDYTRNPANNFQPPAKERDDPFRKQVDALLTDAQKAKRAELLGKPFDVALIRPTR